MKLLGWLKKKKINDNHYLADNDYERRYSSCRRCNGTGRYHSDIDNC